MLLRVLSVCCLLACLSCSKPLDTTGMVLIPAGEFVMGNNDGFPNEAPAHPVRLDEFWMDETEVTNAQFEKFAEETGYLTTAEDIGDAGVFSPEEERWKLVRGANWRYPAGRPPPSEGRDALPVVQVSWHDAVAYCTWAAKRLPTEAEFEYAARGGLDGATYAWGDEFRPRGLPQANTWQGEFPHADPATDGYAGLAPVASFPPNGFALYDMAGNVSEWVNDWYDPEYYHGSPVTEPPGPREGREKVHRGGSWLCADGECTDVRVASRLSAEPETGVNDIGFRCVAGR